MLSDLMLKQFARWESLSRSLKQNSMPNFFSLTLFQKIFHDKYGTQKPQKNAPKTQLMHIVYTFSSHGFELNSIRKMEGFSAVIIVFLGVDPVDLSCRSCWSLSFLGPTLLNTVSQRQDFYSQY